MKDNRLVRIMSWLLTLPAVVVASVLGDEITYRDATGQEVVTTARLIGEGQGFQALERRDGQIQLVPNGGVLDRQVAGDPEPLDVAGMQDIFSTLFGADQVRFEPGTQSLVVLVLDGPLDKQGENRCHLFLKKAGTFMKNVDGVFLKFAKQMKFPLRDLRYPLVLMIFESDLSFEAYANQATGDRGLSATNILGFYSNLTNWLAVRLSSCDSFEVPLHEAIHQQMYNRVLQRLSPIPKWFDEGIATGFEASGQNINVHPMQVNSRYARQSQQLAGNVDWQSIVNDDSAFTTDVLAGDAYTLAWCMHWMLVSERKAGYQTYVQELAKLTPLSQQAERARLQHFEDSFGQSVPELQERFSEAIRLGIKRQKIDVRDQNPPGFAETQQQLGLVQIRAINANGVTRVDGQLKNISPLRTMTFYITFESETGQYTDWLLSDLKPGQTLPLPPQTPNKFFGARGGSGDRFQLWIRSVPADSEAAATWKSGKVPGPISAQN